MKCSNCTKPVDATFCSNCDATMCEDCCLEDCVRKLPTRNKKEMKSIPLCPKCDGRLFNLTPTAATPIHHCSKCGSYV